MAGRLVIQRFSQFLPLKILFPFCPFSLQGRSRFPPPRNAGRASRCLSIPFFFSPRIFLIPLVLRSTHRAPSLGSQLHGAGGPSCLASRPCYTPFNVNKKPPFPLSFLQFFCFSSAMLHGSESSFAFHHVSPSKILGVPLER